VLPLSLWRLDRVLQVPYIPYLFLDNLIEQLVVELIQ
jgi:hypothetical protein